MLPTHSNVHAKPSFIDGVGEFVEEEGGRTRIELLPNSSAAPPIHPGHHRDKLDLIRDSLRPFEQAESPTPVVTTYTQPAVGESSSSLNQPDDETLRLMIHALTQVGYDKELAYCALKLVKFRSAMDAAILLSSLKHSDFDQQQRLLKAQLTSLSHAPSFANGSRNESPLDFYASTNEERTTTSSFLGSTKSLPVGTFTAAPNGFEANGNGITVNGSHLSHTSVQPNGRLTPEFLPQPAYGMSNVNPQKLIAFGSRNQLKQTASLDPLRKFNNNEDELDAEFISQSTSTVFYGYDSPRPPITRSKLEALAGNKIVTARPNLKATSSTPAPAKHTNPVQRIVVDPDRVPQSTPSPRDLDQTPLLRMHHHAAEEERLQHVANLRIDDSSPQPTISINGQPVERSGPARSVSPLPPSIGRRLASGAKFEGVVRPCKAAMFQFFMEQHTEKLTQQYTERNKRAVQLAKEMEAADLAPGMREKMLKYLRQKESRYIRLKRQKMNKNMFDLIRHIGVGAFGKVTLVRKKDTGEVYAMKTLSKADVIQKQQAAHVKAERDILSEANSDWVVKLFFSFQDSHNLYFIMEYVPGGDLMQLLINKGIFSESLARRYTAELTCAIEYVHDLGFIHRDVKPDNILIDKEGHIKLTDFGLCTGLRWTHDKKHYVSYNDPNNPNAHYRNDSFQSTANIANGNDPNLKLLQYRQHKKRNCAHSVVGTGNYMSPEVCARTGHTQVCDWWSVGVILYEMVFGRPPFLSQTDDPSATQYMASGLQLLLFTLLSVKIMNWPKYLNLNNPSGAHLSRACIEIIAGLCCDEKDRLGSRGAKEVKAHHWFRGLDFSTLRQTPAEFVPKVEHAEDTSNFDTFDVKMEEFYRDTYKSDKSYNPAFFDFTFRHFFASDGPHKQPHHASRNQQRPRLAPVFERPPNGSESTAIASEAAEQQRPSKPTEMRRPVEHEANGSRMTSARTSSPRISHEPFAHPIVSRQLRPHEPPAISAFMRNGQEASFSHTVRRYGDPNERPAYADDSTQSFV